MHTRHLVVIGASAGGIEALRELVAALPPDFPLLVGPGRLRAACSVRRPSVSSSPVTRTTASPAGHVYSAESLRAEINASRRRTPPARCRRRACSCTAWQNMSPSTRPPTTRGSLRAPELERQANTLRALVAGAEPVIATTEP